MSDERQVRMIAPSMHWGEALNIDDEPILPNVVADRLVNRGRAVELGTAAAPVAVATDPAPAKTGPARGKRSNRGAAAVTAAPAADPAKAEPVADAAPQSAPAADPVAGADLPEIGETI